MPRSIAPVSLTLATLLVLSATLLEGGVERAYAGAASTSTVSATAAATGTAMPTVAQAATPSPTVPAAATATTTPTSAPTTAPTSPTATPVASTLPDLLLVVSASPDPVAAGQVLSYFLTVHNEGDVISGPTSVIGQIPDGTSVNSLSAGCTEDPPNRIFRCQVLPLGPGQQVSFQVNLNVTATSGLLLNRFAVDATNAVVESDETNNLVDRNVQVFPTTAVPAPPAATATLVTVTAPPDPPLIVPPPAPLEPAPAPPVEPVPAPAPEPVLPPPPPAGQVWLQVLETTPAVSNDGEVLWDAQPGEWYQVVMEEGGWALVIWEGDPPEFTEWIEVDSRVQLGLY